MDSGMRPFRAALPSAFLALLTVGVAATPAQGGLGATTIEIDPLRVGDKMTFEWQGDFFRTGNETFTVQFEAVHRAVDGFGVERGTEAYRYEVRDGAGAVQDSRRCEVLAGGLGVVREELLEGDPDARTYERETDIPGLQTYITFIDTPFLQFHGVRDECRHIPFVKPGRYSEGDRLSPLDVGRPASDSDAELAVVKGLRSAPATATTFEGHKALRFEWDLAPLLKQRGDPAGAFWRYSVVLADGLPGFVATAAELGVDGSGGSQREATWTKDRLVGLQRGHGASQAQRAFEGHELPRTNPDGAFARVERLGLDDDAYGLAFRFAEAWNAMRAEPSTGLADFLDAHPEAHLRTAAFDAGRRPTLLNETPPQVAGQVPTDGGWDVNVCDRTACLHAAVTRYTDALRLRGATYSFSQDGFPSEPSFVPVGQEPTYASSATLLAALKAADPEMGPIQSLWYHVGAPGVFAALYLGDVSNDAANATPRDGHLAILDQAAGTVWDVGKRSVSVAGAVPHLGAAPRGGLAPGPGSQGLGTVWTALGVGGAVAATVGLVALVKWLSDGIYGEFFTRVSESRLLQSPTRRRLLDYLQAHPGAHFQQLRREIATGRGNLQAHLDKLVRAGLVSRVASASHTLYFAKGALPAPVMQALGLTKSPGAQRLLAAAVGSPGITLGEAAARAGITVATASHHMARLCQAGLLGSDRQGRTVRLHGTPMGIAVVAQTADGATASA